MSATDNVHLPRFAPVDIRAQVNATHNTNFPFSSPMLDDHGSLRSMRTGNTALSRNPFESLNSSTTTLTDYESGATSEQDAWHLERYSESSKPGGSKHLATSKPPGKSLTRSPGLQIITDFSKPSYHASNLVIDHVQARQAQTRPNRARSIVSHKGVKVESSQAASAKRNSALLNVRSIIPGKREKRKAVVQPSGKREIERKRSEKSIVIGLRIPQDEAHALQQQGELDSSLTLNTPLTPAIILTPPDEKLEQALKSGQLLPSTTATRRPASSVYSMITCSKEYSDEDDHVPPLPQLPPFAKAHNMQIAESTPSNGHNLFISGIRGTDQTSPRSGDQIPESCDTPRSQGWWNLLLSPMLSRTGSSASKRIHETDQSPPPVPEIPSGLEKNLPTASPNTNTSPETPRRLGLACTPADAWSSWNEIETQILGTNSDVMDEVADDAQLSASELPGKVFPVKYVSPEMVEGLAAEYYHACAIEQLTGVEYFECINHSCQHHLPKLMNSNVDPHGEIRNVGGDAVPQSHTKAIMLGSPFESNKGTYPVLSRNVQTHGEGDDSSITDFESDEETDIASKRSSRSSPAKDRELYTPLGSEGEPDELSPNIRKANTAAFVKAKARGINEPVKPIPESVKKQSLEQMPNLAAFVSQNSTTGQSLPKDAPATQHTEPLPTVPVKLTDKPVPALPPRSEQSTPSTPNVQFQPKPQLLSQQFFVNPNGGFTGLPATPAAVRVHRTPPTRKESLANVKRAASFDAESRNILDVREKKSKKSRDYCFALRNIFPSKRNKKDKPTNEKKRRRGCVICICFLLLAIVVVCIVLAITLTRRGDGTPVSSRWLNLTGYPPMPIGISTIAQPDLAQSQTGCVQPPTLWSCSLPKDDQERAASNGSSIPDFRFEIKYRNGTTPANMNIPLTKRANDPFTNDLFTSNPAPPNDADQLFLGNTTDNITAPFNGEMTPFYITFMSTFPVVPSAFNSSTNKLKSRQSNLGINIPAPGSLPDGSALPASLLPTSPFPTSQPVRLYNRGHEDEHYGFYIYYDKSVFLTGISMSGGNTTVSDAAGSDADKDGGATKDAAKTRCTWQQTRFLVKIFTNNKFGGSIFPGRQNVSLDTSEQSEYSSATDFQQPGSFPYATSVIIDRHGGNINNKITYCYGMDRGKIAEDEKVLVFENRSAGGSLINGAPAFVNSNNNNNDANGSFDSGAGGIDGGTGGCSCTWQNWK